MFGRWRHCAYTHISTEVTHLYSSHTERLLPKFSCVGCVKALIHFWPMAYNTQDADGQLLVSSSLQHRMFMQRSTEKWLADSHRWMVHTRSCSVPQKSDWLTATAEWYIHVHATFHRKMTGWQPPLNEENTAALVASLFPCQSYKLHHIHKIISLMMLRKLQYFGDSHPQAQRAAAFNGNDRYC